MYLKQKLLETIIAESYTNDLQGRGAFGESISHWLSL